MATMWSTSCRGWKRGYRVLREHCIGACWPNIPLNSLHLFYACCGTLGQQPLLLPPPVFGDGKSCYTVKRKFPGNCQPLHVSVRPVHGQMEPRESYNMAILSLIMEVQEAHGGPCSLLIQAARCQCDILSSVDQPSLLMMAVAVTFSNIWKLGAAPLLGSVVSLLLAAEGRK